MQRTCPGPCWYIRSPATPSGSWLMAITSGFKRMAKRLGSIARRSVPMSSGAFKMAQREKCACVRSKLSSTTPLPTFKHSRAPFQMVASLHLYSSACRQSTRHTSSSNPELYATFESWTLVPHSTDIQCSCGTCSDLADTDEIETCILMNVY